MQSIPNRWFTCLALVMAIIGLTSISASAFNGITEKDTLSLKLRTIYFDRDYEKDSSDDSTLAEGIELNYESGVIGGIASIGGSIYAVRNIHSDGSAENNILPAGDDKAGIDDHISKIGQLFVNFKLTDNGNVKIGTQTVKAMLISSSGSRAIPNTFRGVTANYKLNNFKLYGYAFDKWSPRHEDKWQKFTTELAEQIDLVWGIGTTYKKAGFEADAEYLVSQDYLAKLGVRGGYTWKIDKSKLKVSGGYFTSTDNGDLFKPGAEKDLDKNQDIDGSAYYIAADWKVSMFSFGAAYTQVFDMWVEDNFAGDHGTNPFPTRAPIGPDLTNANEKVWLASVGLNFDKFVKGLSTKISYAKGTDAENSLTGAAGGTAEEDFILVDTKWKVPYVKGLSCRWLYNKYNADEVGKIAGVKGDETDHRVYVDYVVQF